MFIDIHVHVRRHPSPLRHGKPAYATPDQLLERYKTLGVERAILLPEVNPECTYMPQSNEEILELCESYPLQFVPFCNIDPRAMANAPDAPLGDLMCYYRDRGCRGLGEICANLPFLDAKVLNLFRHAQEIGLPVIFHVSPEIGRNYGLYDDPGLPQLERCLALFPDLRFLGHSQAFWAEIGRLDTPGDRWGYPRYPVKQEGVVPILMRRYPNLHGDLSAGSGYNALRRDPEYAVQFLNEFQDRLLFGTDICAPDTETPLAGFLIELRDSKKITEAVFNKVARENAIRLLALG